jgi:hypothetical protein
MFVVTKAPGLCMAMPDVCKQPAGPAMVPVPFVNLAPITMAQATALKVKVRGMPVIVKPDVIARSMADEPGTGGGGKSGMNMGMVSFNDASKLLNVMGSPAVLHLSPTGQNGGGNANAVGAVMTPTQNLLDAAR